MKSVSSAIAIAAMTATPALAVDLPVKAYTKAPVANSANGWTGFYLFGGFGYGMWADDQQTIYEGANFGPSVRRGYFGTVGGGYDYQFASKWMAGVFGDARFGDINGTQDWFQGAYFGSTTNRLSYAAGVRLG